VTDAFYAILTFVIGALLGFFVARRSVGERRWREGYLYGFNLAWDEKAKMDQELQQRHLKDIRRKRPRFHLVKGEK
jgi:hypothetical protein